MPPNTPLLRQAKIVSTFKFILLFFLSFIISPFSTLAMSTPLYNALIRTHHITSRKKVAALKRAADTHSCFVLLRSGGCPGIMYVEGLEQGQVEGWVGVVKRLRYKDFQLVRKPAELVPESGSGSEVIPDDLSLGRAMGRDVGLNEVESVKEFGSLMAQRGVWGWWRKGMGYS
jgi:hypothetical protein